MNYSKEEIKKLSVATSETDGTSLITLYIPGNAQLSQFITRLTKEMSSAQNIKDKAVRQEVQYALKSGIQALRSYPGYIAPDNGLILLSGHLSNYEMCCV